MLLYGVKRYANYSIVRNGKFVVVWCGRNWAIRSGGKSVVRSDFVKYLPCEMVRRGCWEYYAIRHGAFRYGVYGAIS